MRPDRLVILVWAAGVVLLCAVTSGGGPLGMPVSSRISVKNGRTTLCGRGVERLSGALRPAKLFGRRSSTREGLRPCAEEAEEEPVASITARWSFDVKYGKKQEAVTLMYEWIQTIGGPAGVSGDNCRLLSGAIGVKESRVEMEIEYPTMNDLEKFWMTIDRDDHEAWSARMQNCMVDASPVWEIYRKCPLPSAEEIQKMRVESVWKTLDNNLAAAVPWQKYGSAPQTSVVQEDDEEDYVASVDLTTGETKVIHDINGNPIKLNKGDSIPDLAPENSVTFGNFTFIMPEDFKPIDLPPMDEILNSDKLRSPILDEPDFDDEDYFPKEQTK